MGADPTPTLAQVKHLIDTGQLHYILLGGPGGGAGGLGGGTSVGGPSGGAGAGGHTTASTAVETRDKWIESHGTAVDVPGQSASSTGATLYYFANGS